MATFRNSQIEEILNHERRLNRTIMDRQKQHVSAIGDQRAPPTMRDIKLESLLGQQIDELKEEINKVIQLISPFQFGKLDDAKIERLLKFNTKQQSGVNIESSQNDINESKEPPQVKKEGDKKIDIQNSGVKPGEDDNVVVAPSYTIG
jgi:hypothetical protein